MSEMLIMIDSQTFRVVAENIAKSEPMNIADAHNYALEIKDTTDGLVEVVETFEWFCVKCGDDYWTQYEEEYKSVKKFPRWRCRSCVMGLL